METVCEKTTENKRHNKMTALVSKRLTGADKLTGLGPGVDTPAVRSHTLVAAVLHVPVFALHSWIGAAGSYADVWSGG